MLLSQHIVIKPELGYGLNLSITTTAQHMKSLGYSTHIVGKWVHRIAFVCLLRQPCACVCCCTDDVLHGVGRGGGEVRYVHLSSFNPSWNRCHQTHSGLRSMPECVILFVFCYWECKLWQLILRECECLLQNVTRSVVFPFFLLWNTTRTSCLVAFNVFFLYSFFKALLTT